MIKTLMERFVKSNLMEHVTDAKEADVAKIENLRQYTKVDVGFTANRIVKELLATKKISDKQNLEFRMACRSFLQSLVCKLLMKSPLNYKLVKNLSVFDPRYMAADDERDRNKVKLRNLIQHLIDANRIHEQDADVIIQQYTRYVDEIVAKDKSKYADFLPSPVNDRNSERVDVLFYDTMASNKAFSKLWEVVRQVLVLSHGQALVEHGFSVNKEMEVDNMSASTFVAKRLICDHIRTVGGILNVDIQNKQLQLSCATARQKYASHLEDQKRQKVDQKKGQKRKALADEVDQLKSKKQQLQTDTDSLAAAADEFAEKAEKHRNLTLIAKSNAMRKSAREKEVELKAVDQQLHDTLLQLSNCQ